MTSEMALDRKKVPHPWSNRMVHIFANPEPAKLTLEV